MKKLCSVLVLALLVACNSGDSIIDGQQKSVPETLAAARIQPNQLTWTAPNLSSFYQANNNVTLWNSQNNRGALLDVLVLSHKDGLKIDKFPINQMFAYQANYHLLNAENRTKADAVYTNAFLQLSKRIAEGHINPKKFYGDWEAYKKSIDYEKIMVDALSNNKVEDALEQLTPKNQYYKNIKQAYVQYDGLISKDTVRPITANDQSKVAYQLALLGDSKANPAQLSEEELTDALKHFQQRNGLSQTGKLDESTLKTLNIPVKDLQKKLAVNLERARWIPDEFGDKYVMVNIAEAHLYLVNNGEVISDHKVIVGKPARRTPVLSSKFSQLVINPTWTVPPTILKKDLAPQASRDSTYFARKNMTIYNNKGEEVSPGEWNAEQAKAYRYVQRPGGGNALGLIKFDFPNNHMVYLHDTSSRGLFGRKNRTLSSGCVRVQNPFDLAGQILQLESSKNTKDDLLEIVNQGKTKFMALKKQVAVHQLYWTAWADENGEVQFRKDVYNFDDTLYKKIN